MTRRPPDRNRGDHVDTVQQRAERIAGEVFTGGPVEDFERVGRLQLVTLLEEGLLPQHRVLDIGCGALRAGYWLIHFLQPSHYFGIEPNVAMLHAGRDRILEPGLEAVKKPTFDHNDRFDCGVFGVTFDAMLARSVWTHASKDQIEAMLEGFAATGSVAAFFLASYLPAKRGLRRKGRPDYRGTEWLGRSHMSTRAGMVAHDLRWITAACAGRGLRVMELDREEVNKQRWLRVERA